MTKEEFIDAVVTELAKKEDAFYSFDEIRKIFNAEITVIMKTLKKGERIKFVGIGSFSVKKMARRKGLNPRTLETINIPAHNTVRFVPGKNLKDFVN